MKVLLLAIILTALASTSLAQQYHQEILPRSVNSEREEILPVWNPAGDTLFFLSDRRVEDRPQLNRIWFSRYENGLFDTPRVYDEIKYTHEVGGIARDHLGNVIIASSIGSGGSGRSAVACMMSRNLTENIGTGYSSEKHPSIVGTASLL